MRHSKEYLKEEHKKLLKSSFLFRDLNYEDFTLFLDKYDWHLEGFEKDNICFREEMFTKEYNFLLEGQLRIIKLLEEGQSVLYDLLKTGGMFGVASLYTNIKMENLQAEIMSDSLLFIIPENSFRKMIIENPFILEKYIELHEYRLHFFVRRFENTFITNPYDKLIYFFSYLKKFGMKELCMSKCHLAEYLNIGRASLYRELNKLTKKKVISFDRDKIKF